MPVAREATMLGPGMFRFLNQAGTVTDPVDWNDPNQAKLWLYNLHYFDDLNSRDAGDREHWHRALLEQWVRENPPGTGNGWEPYPCSLRIVNWVKWALGGAQLEAAWRQSLAVQARWLERHLEYHLLGNHLFANAKALVFAGLFFEGDEPERWLHLGRRILDREVTEQILPDGGHFERSPMYHVIIFEDLLDLLNVHYAYGVEPPPAWREVAGRMLGALSGMQHPDGEIAFFNDAAVGIAPTPGAVRDYAVRLGLYGDEMKGLVVSLPDTGYFRLASGPAVCIADVAPIGPDYLPGHAHADTLSFELSLDGQRVFVNSGTSEYGTSAERLRQRGTAAHNTVVVNGLDSSEVWSGFRVARRARPLDVEYGVNGEEVWLAGSHDGYRRLSRALLHRRAWQLNGSGLSVQDELTGAFDVACARFHLHPTTTLIATGERKARFCTSAGREVVLAVDGGTLRVEPATYHPEFGAATPTQCLVVEFHGPHCESHLYW
ncbi:heparinase II/III family protein [Arhodomonas aquaeolei]|uniref:heparinase II/III family protein n=1 Tax=Arhodomonas aquaeolei TaxID=2369 RepID=UPI000374CC2F|nr:heparinase II/III family protein [Arhodomonas aquaeolei]